MFYAKPTLFKGIYVYKLQYKIGILFATQQHHAILTTRLYVKGNSSNVTLL